MSYIFNYPGKLLSPYYNNITNNLKELQKNKDIENTFKEYSKYIDIEELEEDYLKEINKQNVEIQLVQSKTIIYFTIINDIEKKTIFNKSGFILKTEIISELKKYNITKILFSIENIENFYDSIIEYIHIISLFTNNQTVDIEINFIFFY